MPKLPLFQLSVERQNRLKEILHDAKQSIKDRLGLRNTFGDRILIKDEVLVWQGKKLLFKSKGHIVSQGLTELVNLMGVGGTTTTYGTPGSGCPYLLLELLIHEVYRTTTTYGTPGSGWADQSRGKMLVGTGTGATTAAMTGLVTPNSTLPTTVTELGLFLQVDTTTQSGLIANPTAGVYRVSFIATWAAAALTAITVTELGLFLQVDTTLRAFNGTVTPANYVFFSRLSSSDGDFTAFLVNIAVPLTVEWRLTFTFA